MQKFIALSLLVLTLSFSTFSPSWAQTQPAVPHDLETCFSPEGRCDQRLYELIHDAKRTLDIAIYDLTLTQIEHEIEGKALKDHLKIRIVVDRLEAHGTSSLVPALARFKDQNPQVTLEIRYGFQKGRGIMHNKFTIKDEEMLETGSFNYSEGATQINHENQIYLADVQVLHAYQDQFESIWKTALDVKSSDFKADARRKKSL